MSGNNGMGPKDNTEAKLTRFSTARPRGQTSGTGNWKRGRAWEKMKVNPGMAGWGASGTSGGHTDKVSDKSGVWDKGPFQHCSSHLSCQLCAQVPP